MIYGEAFLSVPWTPESLRMLSLENPEEFSTIVLAFPLRAQQNQRSQIYARGVETFNKNRKDMDLVGGDGRQPSIHMMG